MEQKLPRHIAAIMDGNGRWATMKGRRRSAGHKRGAEVFEEAVDHMADLGIEAFTVHAFAMNNWNRNQLEVRLLMQLLSRYIRRKKSKMLDRGVRLRFIGNRDDVRMLRPLLRQMEEIESATEHCNTLMLQIAVNYSGEDEVRRATSQMLSSGTEDLFPYLDLPSLGLPNPDIVIRTGLEEGVWRDSGFLPLSTMSAVKVPMTLLWPDFGLKHINDAIRRWQNEAHLSGGQRT